MTQFFIYCYTNSINGKKYIGQTNNIERRKKQHLEDSYKNYNEARYNQVIHQAIRKYGIQNFIFEILEVLPNREEANKKEQELIKSYDTISPKGYNISEGGGANPRKGTSKILTKEKLQEVIQDLKNGKKIKTIANEYNISVSYVSDINNGRRLKQSGLDYPLQKNRSDANFYLYIIDQLKNTTKTMSEISRENNICKATVGKINNGHTQIIRDIYKDSFPIRDNSKYKSKTIN